MRAAVWPHESEAARLASQDKVSTRKVLMNRDKKVSLLHPKNNRLGLLARDHEQKQSEGRESNPNGT